LSKNQAAPSDLIRADRRDSFRATVLACATPLVLARCNSGCAAFRASAAADLLPLFDAVPVGTLVWICER